MNNKLEVTQSLKYLQVTWKHSIINGLISMGNKRPTNLIVSLTAVIFTFMCWQPREAQCHIMTETRRAVPYGGVITWLKRVYKPVYSDGNWTRFSAICNKRWYNASTTERKFPLHSPRLHLPVKRTCPRSCELHPAVRHWSVTWTHIQEVPSSEA